MTEEGQAMEPGGEAEEIQKQLFSARERINELEGELRALEGGGSGQAEHYRSGLEVMRSEWERTREELEETAGKLKKAEFDLSFQEQVTLTQVRLFEEEIALLQRQQEMGAGEREEQKGETFKATGSLEEANRSIQHLKQVIKERELQISRQLEELERLREAPAVVSGDTAANSAEAEDGVTALRQKLEQALADKKAAEAELERLGEATADKESEALAGLKTVGVVVGGRGEVDVIRKLRRQKQASEEKVQQLEAEAQRMRSLMEQDKAQDAEPAETEDDSDALRNELALVRDRAEADLARMNDEVKKLESKLKAQELAGSAEAAEKRVFHQEVDQLRQQSEQREEVFERVTKEKLGLREQIEERNSEVDRLGQALDMAWSESKEVGLKHQQEVESRGQLEAALYRSEEELERLLVQGLTDGTRPAVAAGGGSPEAGGRQRVMVSVLIGAALAFAIAEGLSIVSGRGEIVSGAVARLGSPSGSPRVVKPMLQPPATGRADPPPQRVGEPPLKQSPPAGVVADAGKPPASAGGEADRLSDSPSSTQGAKNEPATVGARFQDRLASGGRGPVMIDLRGGVFTMGSQRYQLPQEERVAHRVEVGGFAIGKYEVTFDEYQRFARASGRPTPDDQDWGRGHLPVINVTWQDADAYTRWLSRETGRYYRLPTEAEWEYAAAGGTNSYYWWGHLLGENNANCFNCGSRWDKNSPAPVGSFKANPYGLHDMVGNVMEWVQDCYHTDYQGAPGDGSAWLETGCRERVVRGGGFNKPGDTLRTTKRSGQQGNTRLPVLGFRVVRDVR